VTQKDRTDRGGRDADPELEEFTADPLVPPSWILPAEAGHQIDGLVIEAAVVRRFAA